MNKKPSERIFQLFSEFRQVKGGNKNEDRIKAVIEYLDEIYQELNTTQKHECVLNGGPCCIFCGKQSVGVKEKGK